MFSGNNDFTMPVMPAYANNGNAGFGGDGAWWIIVFVLFFAFGGWGNNGWGGNNAGLQGALTRGDLCQDMNFNNLDASVRAIQSGLCDGFYAQNTTMLNGFNGVQRDMCTGFANVNAAINQARFDSQQCCCETNRNIDAVRFENAQNTCAITNAIHAEGEQTRALINANTMQDLRDKIADKDRDLLAANFQISQVAQTTDIVNQIKPCPIPAYLSCSPYQSFGPYGYGGGYGNGCGCGNNSGCGCC